MYGHVQPFYYMLAELASSRVLFVRHHFVPLSGVERRAMNENQPSTKTTTVKNSWQCGHTHCCAHFHTIYLTSDHTCCQFSFALRLLPSGSLRKQWGKDQCNPAWQELIEWLKRRRRRRRKQTNSRRGRRAVTLDKMSNRCYGSSSNSISDGFMCYISNEGGKRLGVLSQ